MAAEPPAGECSHLIIDRHALVPRESVRAKRRADGGVKNEKIAEIVLIYAGLERSELASDSAKQKQLKRRVPALQALLVLSQKPNGLPGRFLCCCW